MIILNLQFLAIYYTSTSNMSLRPSPTKLNPRTIINIAKPGKSENHHVSGKKEAPLATIVPRSGVGDCAPNPKKLKDEPTKITNPRSNVIFVKREGRQLGSISRNIICNFDAPIISAAVIYPSVLIDLVIL